MAFRDLNKKKFNYLLKHGVHENELRDFFNDTVKLLALRGAKIRNVPRGHSERVQVICERLPPKTDDVLRTWFHGNISLSDPMEITDVIDYLELYVDDSRSPPDAEISRLARSALIYLFEEHPDPNLISLLQRPSGATETQSSELSKKPKTNTPSLTEAEESDSPKLESYQVAALITSIITEDDKAIDEALVPFSRNTRTLVEALLRLKEGNVPAAKEQLALISEDTPESELISRALLRAKHKGTTSSTFLGVRIENIAKLGTRPKLESYEIIGNCQRVTEKGAVFVQPTAVIFEGVPYLLHLEDRIALFPDSGDVMTLHRHILDRVPARGDVVHWRVAEHERVEGKTRFHLEAELNTLREVINIPAPSSDPDEVRERIKATASSAARFVRQEFVFLLSDGVAVISPRGADVTRDETYTRPWQALSSFSVWLIEGRQYSVDWVEKSSSYLDLSPPDVAFKKFLKRMGSEQRVPLSNTQVRELATRLNEYANSELRLSARRLTAALEQIAIEGDELEAVMTLLRTREEVRRRTNEIIEKELLDRQAERSGLLNELEDLRRKKQNLEKEGRELQRSNKKLAESAESAVRDAFAKAIKDGTTTLANVEIFRTLLSSSPKSPEGPMPVTNPEQWRQVRDPLPIIEVKKRLSALGLNTRQATILAELWNLAVNSHTALLLKGRIARQCAQLLIRLNCSVAGIVDIPMGLTSTSLLPQIFVGARDVRRMAILNADLSPMAVYGACIFDLIFENAWHETDDRFDFIFACDGGDMSLPLPEFTRHVSIIVDLDSSWDTGRLTLEALEIDSIDLLDPLRKKLLDGVNKLDAGLREHIDRVLARSFGAEETSLSSDD